MVVLKPTIQSRPARSGNFTRGRNTRVTDITFHHIVGDAPAAINRFCHTDDGVSATYIIGSDGTIYQNVADNDTPHTNGNFSSNSRSITIEHAGGHANVPYTDAMYNASIQLVAWLIQTYGITTFRRHRDIIPTACPGGLNVEHIINNARATLDRAEQGVPIMIPDQDNYYMRYGVNLASRLRGRQLSRDEFRTYIVGQTDLRAIEILSDNTEADQIQDAQNLGVIAVRDNWANQIHSLLAAQTQLSQTITDLQKVVANVQADDQNDKQSISQGLEKIATLTNQIEAINTTQANNEAAIKTAQAKAPSATKSSWFVKLLAALTTKK